MPRQKSAFFDAAFHIALGFVKSLSLLMKLLVTIAVFATKMVLLANRKLVFTGVSFEQGRLPPTTYKMTPYNYGVIFVLKLSRGFEQERPEGIKTPQCGVFKR